MRLCTMVLPLCAIAACGPVRINASGYETTCVVDEDCMLVTFDDVCAGCATVPIAATERERANEAMAAAEAMCLTGIAECLQVSQAGCVDGACAAVPLGS